MNETPTFTAPATPFMGAHIATGLDGLKADAALFGAPHGTPYPKIDNRVHEDAPDALRRSFEEDAEWSDHWNFDYGGDLLNGGSFSLADLGNLQTQSLQGAENRRLIEAAARGVLAAGAVPMMIGGDDSVPIPFLAAFDSGAPITIVQVDAHIDWRDERRGEPWGYSSTMRRASEMAHVERIVQVGMRGFGSARRGEVEFARDWGAEIVTARQIHAEGVSAALDHIPAGARCVFTIDCDALDCGIMPAVMAPAPGGLSYTQAIDLLAGVVAKGELAGFDMIEFVPRRDPSGVAAVTAAGIVANVVGLLANR